MTCRTLAMIALARAAGPVSAATKLRGGGSAKAEQLRRRTSHD